MIKRYHPEAAEMFADMGWELPDQIDRVYVTEQAERVLGYQPKHDFMDYLLNRQKSRV